MPTQIGIMATLYIGSLIAAYHNLLFVSLIELLVIRQNQFKVHNFNHFMILMEQWYTQFGAFTMQESAKCLPPSDAGHLRQSANLLEIRS